MKAGQPQLPSPSGQGGLPMTGKALPIDFGRRLRRARSVDDLAPLVREYGCQPFSPRLQRLGGQTGPVGDLADDPERGAAAIRPGGVARKLLVGHVRVVLERSGRLDEV